ncbi:MAG: DUF3883 domain-containing protein, partial [Oligoflexales bacterium]|nr:DUF3883 domain-containing protein [Oligoflexales bacterium]
RGSLKEFEQKFPHHWLYVAELIQNAVDEKATVIRFRIENDSTLIFEHDGEEFDFDRDVIGVSTKGISSKGIGTIGFMGVGFKAVFRAYAKARISSAGWRFCFNVPITIEEEYDIGRREWLGAVLPCWDEGVPPPSNGMRCRIELTDRILINHTIESDLQAVFKEDKSLLVLLARYGVRQVDWNGDVWDLDIERTVTSGSVTRFHVAITDSNVLKTSGSVKDSTECHHRWLIFSIKYDPTKSAIRKFLSYRQLIPITPEEKLEASRARSVEAFFELDSNNFPLLPDRGEAYAFLPTGIILPIGVNIQADWLLAQSRQELMDANLEDNPWHCEIMANIPILTKHFFEWLTNKDGPKMGIWNKAYKILPLLDQSEVCPWFFGSVAPNARVFGSAYCVRLREELSKTRFMIRDSGDGVIDFISPENARVLPRHLAESCGDRSDSRPWILYGEYLVSRESLGQHAESTLREIGLLKEITPNELQVHWSKGVVKDWYESFDEKVKDRMLESLFAGLHAMDSNKDWRTANLKCFPSENEFVERSRAIRFPGLWHILKNDEEFSTMLQPFIKKHGSAVSWDFDRSLSSGSDPSSLNARLFLETVTKIDLSSIMADWWNSLSYSETNMGVVVRFTAYICEKFPQMKDLVKKVVCINEDGQKLLLPFNEVFLAEPYAGEYRHKYNPVKYFVADCYFQHNDSLDWKAFFESYEPPVSGRFKPIKILKELDRAQCNSSGFEVEMLRTTERTVLWTRDPTVRIDNKNYYMVDFGFPKELKEALHSGNISSCFGKWLGEDAGTLHIYTRKYLLYIPRHQYNICEMKDTRNAEWIQTLSDCRWIYSKINTGPFKPEDVLRSFDDVRPNAPVADLDLSLIKLLEGAGVFFGTNIPKPGPIERLERMGESLGSEELFRVIEDIIKRNDPEEMDSLQKMVGRKALVQLPECMNLLDGSKRIPLTRIVKKVGPGYRSHLGWVVAADDLAEKDHKIGSLLNLLQAIHPLPPKTTAAQAIQYLEWVYRTKPEIESISKYLPSAYSYIVEVYPHDIMIQNAWQKIRSQAVVYTYGRRWMEVMGVETIYLNDLQITEFTMIKKEHLAIPYHLGATDRPGHQIAAVKLLGLTAVSHVYKVVTRKGGPVETPDSWRGDFLEIQKAMLEILNINEEIEDSDAEIIGTVESKKILPLDIARLQDLFQEIIKIETGKTSVSKAAYAINEGRVALVCGKPEDFADALCEVLISYYNANRKKMIHKLASSATLVICSLGKVDFRKKINTFREKFGLNPLKDEAPPVPDTTLAPLSENSGSKDSILMENQAENEKNDRNGEVNTKTNPDQYSEEQVRKNVAQNNSPGQSEENGDTLDSRKKEEDNGSVGNEQEEEDSGNGTDEDGSGICKSTGGKGSVRKPGDSSSAMKKSRRLLSYVSRNVSGNLSDDGNDDEEDHESDEESLNSKMIGDAAERYVMLFEESRNFKPTNMNERIPNHEGYDIESIGPDSEKIRIEVKGIIGDWNDRGVSMTKSQFKSAQQYQDSYYLYVVEYVFDDTKRRIHRIRNPASNITQYQFDQGWKSVSEEENGDE